MNWMQKIAKWREITSWRNDLHKSLEFMIPGDWSLYGEELTNINRAGFYGQDLLLKSNALFYAIVTMERPAYTLIWNEEQGREVYDRPVKGYDSIKGAPQLIFGCLLKASGKDKWPTFGTVIGRNTMLDTPVAVAEFIRDCIETYQPPNDDDDQDDPNPIVPDPTGGVEVPEYSPVPSHV